MAVLPLNFTGKNMDRVKELRQFTIRVYGILVDAARGVLVADEYQEGQSFTKFPGGERQRLLEQRRTTRPGAQPPRPRP